jgi:hypothetical protein
MDGRDAIWDHPDLLPTAQDFEDPEGFASNTLDLTALDLGGDSPGDGDSPPEHPEPPKNPET